MGAVCVEWSVRQYRKVVGPKSSLSGGCFLRLISQLVVALCFLCLLLILDFYPSIFLERPRPLHSRATENCRGDVDIRGVVVNQILDFNIQYKHVFGTSIDKLHITQPFLGGSFDRKTVCCFLSEKLPSWV